MKLETLLLQIRVLLRQNLEGNSRAGGSSRAGYGHTHKSSGDQPGSSWVSGADHLPQGEVQSSPSKADLKAKQGWVPEQVPRNQ